MKDKDIQILIDKYLDGASTPEEERQLSVELQRDDIPREWEVVRLMLGELALGEAAYDRIMAERQLRQSSSKRSRKCGWAAMVAVAASLAVILSFPWQNGQSGSKPAMGVGESQAKKEDPVEDVKATNANCRSMTSEVCLPPEKETSPKTTAIREEKNKHVSEPLKKSMVEQTAVITASDTRYEDTLGTGMWKDERKVITAMELLNDCERTIVESSRTIRNGVVEASFNAMPQESGLQLVIDEGGNYVITEDTRPAPIEL